MTDKIKNQQRQFMLYNLLAFSLIFMLFAGVIYSQIEKTIMGGARADLSLARESIENTNDYISRQIEISEFVRAETTHRGETDKTSAFSGALPFRGDEIAAPQRIRPAVPMRAHVVIRDSEGEVLNPQIIGRIYFEGYLDELPFSPAELDRIRSFNLSDGSAYISTSFVSVQGDALYYIQVLANVDGERAATSNFLSLLAVCVAFFVLLSITASYILSRKTMAPVITAWQRQSEFVENASHELRTPLTVIQNKLEALLTAPDATVIERADDVVLALSETRRLTKLTADLMTLARADANETLLDKTPFLLDKLILELCEPYREIAQADGKNMTLETGLTGELVADRERIHELMIILLDNALKYTGAGDSITVRTRPLDGGALIEVQDSGIGMSDESAMRAFDRFYREDKARSRDKGGSGLGLSIAKWIVDAHVGRIELLPALPTGTLVRISLK